MGDIKEIRTADYNYELPDERIAKFPLANRDSSKLLIYNNGRIGHNCFTSLPQMLPSGALMIFNNTKVIQARLHFRKEPAGGPKSQGALIEIFLLEPLLPNDYQLMFTETSCCRWHCLVGNLKRWKEGLLQKRLIIAEKEITLTANRIETSGTGSTIEFRWNGGATFAEILEAIGEIPIPPYLNRESQESDKTTYQTVYSKIKGSVAAPTAGLHFTQDVLAQLDKHGVIRDELTLHVGAGTFRPVKSENIGGHEMHTEYIAVKKSTIEQLIAHDGKAIAVGTTSVRTLESLYYIGTYLKDHPDASEEDMHVSQWTPYQDKNNQLTTVQALQYILNYLEQHALDVLKTSTQIIIAPGYRFHIVNMMITNFHQPQSTLLLLVSAFVHGNWKQIYDYALANDFRFLSYGDSSLLIP